MNFTTVHFLDVTVLDTTKTPSPPQTQIDFFAWGSPDRVWGQYFPSRNPKPSPPSIYRFAQKISSFQNIFARGYPIWVWGVGCFSCVQYGKSAELKTITSSLRKTWENKYWQKTCHKIFLCFLKNGLGQYPTNHVLHLQITTNIISLKMVSFLAQLHFDLGKKHCKIPLA